MSASTSTRQQAAVVRLRRYVGAEKGYEPLTSLARARCEERAGDSEAGRSVGRRGLSSTWTIMPRYLDGTEELLKRSGLKGWQRDMKTLRKQFADYDA